MAAARDRAVVPVLAALGVAVFAVPGISASLWLDEAFTIANSSVPVDEIARLNGGNMLGYYAAWSQFVAAVDAEWVLRLPSVMAMAAAAAVLHFVAIELVGSRHAWLATLAFAVHPLTISYATEARSYAFVVLFTTLSWLAFAKLTVSAPGREAQSWRWAAIWVGASAAACYFHLVAVVVVPAQVSSLLLLQPAQRGLRRWVPAGFAFALLVLPLGVLALGPDAGSPDFVSETTLSGVAATLRWYVGYPSPAVVLLWLGLASAGVTAAVRIASREGQGLALWRRGVPYLWFGGQAFLVFWLSVAQPLFVTRYLLVCLPGAALIMAVGAAAVPRRARLVAVVAAAVVLFAAIPAFGLRAATEDWRSVTSTIAALPGTDGVVFPTPRNRTPVDVYLGWDRHQVPEASPLYPADPWGQPRREYATFGDPLTTWHSGRLWLVRRPGHPPDDDRVAALSGALSDGGWRPVSSMMFEGPIELVAWEQDQRG